MDAVHHIECPLCGHRGKSKALPPAGSTIRCAKCGGKFAFETKTPPHAEVAERGREEAVFKPAETAWTQPRGEWIEADALAGLTTRIALVERRNRLLSWAFVGVAGIAMTGVLTPIGGIPAIISVDQITAAKVTTFDLAVVSDDGRIVARAGRVGDAGQVGVFTAGVAGGDRRSILYPDGMAAFDGDNQRRVVIESGDPKLGVAAPAHIDLLGSKSEFNVEITSEPKLRLRATGSHDLLRMGTKEMNPYLEFWDARGNRFEGMIPQ